MHHSPDHVNDLLAGFVTGTLDPDELDTLEQLILTQPDLVQDVTVLEQTMELMLTSFSTHIQLPPNLGATIQQAAQPRSRLRFRQLKPWQGILGGFAALLVISLGFHNYHLKLALQSQQEVVSLLKAPGSQVYMLRGTSPDQIGGSVLVNLQQQQVILALNNLPTPGDSVYRLWSVVGSKTYPCRDALPVSNGAVMEAFTISPADFQDLYDPDLQGFIVTLEETPTVAQPQGPVILQSI